MVLFSMRLNHGGKFLKEPMYYSEGKCEYYNDVDGDYLNAEKILQLPRYLGYKKNLAIYFRMPRMRLEFGLELIYDDNSVRLLVDEAKKVGSIDLYCDHEDDEKLPNDTVVENDTTDVDVVDHVIVDAPKGDIEEADASEIERESETESDDDECSDPSDNDGDEELINARKTRVEIKNAKEKELEVECEVEVDECDLQTGSVLVEKIGIATPSSDADILRCEIASQEESFENINRGKKVTRGTSIKAGGETSTASRNKVSVAIPTITGYKDIGASTKTTDEPTFSDEEEEDNNFGTKGMKQWSSEYEDSDEDVPASPNSSSNSEWEGDEPKKIEKVVYPIFNPNTPMKEIKFELSMTFTGVEQLRNAILDYAVGKGKAITMPVNEKTRVQARCAKNCPWNFWASYVEKDKCFRIKSIEDVHCCIRATKIKLVRARWLADKFGNTIRSKPRMKLKELQVAIKKRFGLKSSLSQCLEVKKIALLEVEHALKEHYERVWDYGQEIINTNHGSTVNICSDQGTPRRF